MRGAALAVPTARILEAVFGAHAVTDTVSWVENFASVSEHFATADNGRTFTRRELPHLHAQRDNANEFVVSSSVPFS